jgi:4-amino-4-deoxychorismate lyase
MIGRRLVNGAETSAVSADDRGLQYGDGLFETMAAVDGRVRHFGLHLERLMDSCQRLKLPQPDAATIEEECSRVLEDLGAGIVKLIITRGSGPRGYRPPAEPTVTRIVTSSAAQSRNDLSTPVVARMCETRLGLSPTLAGIKHLNRLEQVLASAEWTDPAIAEGLMLANDGRLVAATAANLFLVRGRCVVTPDIRDCGVAGVMRRLALEAAKELGFETAIEDLSPESLAPADEVFLTSAARGIRPVGEVQGHGQWSVGEVTRALAEHIARPDT